MFNDSVESTEDDFYELDKEYKNSYQSVLLNDMLYEAFPEIREEFLDYMGDYIGGSIMVYEMIFSPFVNQSLYNRDAQKIVRIFSFLENIFKLKNEFYSSIVYSWVVIYMYEDVDEDIKNDYMNENLKKLIDEFVKLDTKD